jgi:hypothetical protein
MNTDRQESRQMCEQDRGGRMCKTSGRLMFYSKKAHRFLGRPESYLWAEGIQMDSKVDIGLEMKAVR